MSLRMLAFGLTIVSCGRHAATRHDAGQDANPTDMIYSDSGFDAGSPDVLLDLGVDVATDASLDALTDAIAADAGDAGAPVECPVVDGGYCPPGLGCYQWGCGSEITGECGPMPPTACPEITVCGCDGLFYLDPCAAFEAGTAICNDPGKTCAVCYDK